MLGLRLFYAVLNQRIKRLLAVGLKLSNVLRLRRFRHATINNGIQRSRDMAAKVNTMLR